MRDLVDRSRIMNDLFEAHPIGFNSDDIADAFKNAPTIDAVEVVRHGRWILNKHYGDYECSVCGEGNFRAWDFREHTMNYCPNCGAKMGGKEDAAD